MQAAGRVLDVRDGRARIECASAAASCAACHAGRGCALRWLARSGAPSLEVPAQAVDGPSLAPGDRVTLEVDDGELLRAVMLSYLPPLAGLLGGALVATRMLGGGEVAALLGALAGLGVGWAGARAWLGRAPPGCAVRVEAQGHDD